MILPHKDPMRAQSCLYSPKKPKYQGIYPQKAQRRPELDPEDIKSRLKPTPFYWIIAYTMYHKKISNPFTVLLVLTANEL